MIGHPKSASEALNSQRNGSKSPYAQLRQNLSPEAIKALRGEVFVGNTIEQRAHSSEPIASFERIANMSKKITGHAASHLSQAYFKSTTA